MISEEFYNEVRQSNICPDNFDKIYDEFKEYQNAAIATLNEFHRICEKKSIPYQLAYGSLLGAIRDNGQIPWDYDVDVFVPYEKKDELIATLKKELNDNFYFYCPEVDEKCRHFFIRLAPKGYRTEALHVDVFYVTGVSGDKEEIEKDTKAIKYYFYARYRKLVNIRQECAGNYRRLIRLMLERLKVLFVPINTINKKYYNLCEKYPLSFSDACVSTDSDCCKRLYNTKEMWETELIKTAIGEFRISSNYEEILTQVYGDYKRIYPLENRLDEMIKNYSYLKYYEIK